MTASGSKASELERRLRTNFDGQYAAATPSGTLALAMALRALDVGAGDEVLCPTYVCMEVRDAISYVGARCALCDIDPRTFSLSASTVQAIRTPRTRAIILPHMFGIAADVRAMLKIGIPIVEDLAQGLGARIGDRLVGSFGSATVLSFKAIKVLSAGEGGAVVVRDWPAALRLDELKRRVRPDLPTWSFPMSDVTAAIALSQWSRLGEFLARRRYLALRYIERMASLSALGISLPEDSTGRAWFRFPIRLPRRYPLDQVKSRMSRRGIQVRRPVDPPIHRILGLPHLAFPVAEDVYETVLSLPLYPSLSESDQDRVVDALSQVLSEVSP
jgi:dTDP-4-amino-4,6-dideoxygalactose transaminase